MFKKNETLSDLDPVALDMLILWVSNKSGIKKEDVAKVIQTIDLFIREAEG